MLEGFTRSMKHLKQRKHSQGHTMMQSVTGNEYGTHIVQRVSHIGNESRGGRGEKGYRNPEVSG